MSTEARYRPRCSAQGPYEKWERVYPPSAVERTHGRSSFRMLLGRSNSHRSPSSVFWPGGPSQPLCLLPGVGGASRSGRRRRGLPRLWLRGDRVGQRRLLEPPEPGTAPSRALWIMDILRGLVPLFFAANDRPRPFGGWRFQRESLMPPLMGPASGIHPEADPR